MLPKFLKTLIFNKTIFLGIIKVHFDEVIDESDSQPEIFQDLSKVESTSFATINSQDLLERLFLRGLMISKITSAGGYIVPVTSPKKRTRQVQLMSLFVYDEISSLW